MTVSCFQEVSPVIRRSFWLPVLCCLVFLSTIIVVGIVLMALVIGLSPSLA